VSQQVNESHYHIPPENEHEANIASRAYNNFADQSNRRWKSGWQCGSCQHHKNNHEGCGASRADARFEILFQVQFDSIAKK
jgi:hypothetical protein